MATYRIYYCTQDGSRFSAQDFEASDDVEAIEEAERVAGALRVPAYELYDGDRLVLRRDLSLPPPASGGA